MAIDFPTSLPGVEFAEAWADREISDADGCVVNYLSKPDLIAAKKEAGRPVDLADVDELMSEDL